VTRRDIQRLLDIQVAFDVIAARLLRGTLCDGLVFEPVRVWLVEIGEAVKHIPAHLLASEPGIPWSEVAAMRDRLAHRYFYTPHAILQATVDHDLPELEQAVTRLLDGVEAD
jgi:uncharacterized protein with HEPN domain